MSQRDSLSTINPASIHPPTSPPTPTPEQPSSPPSSNNAKQLSKVILRTALQKANSAVMCDSSNDVVGAIDAYSEAISLLNRVLSTVDKGSDRRRLQEIHDSYSERIRLLSAISPKAEPDDIYETFDNEEHIPEEDDDEYEVAIEDDDARSWLTKPAKRNFSGRRTNQPTYAAMIRRMASSSSLESSMSTPEEQQQQHQQQQQQQRWQAKRSINTTMPVTVNTESSDRPPSPISSKSTPTRSNNRKSSGSQATEDHHHHHHHHHHHRNRSPSSSSNDSMPDPAKDNFQPPMTLPPLLPSKAEDTTPSAPMLTTSATSVASTTPTHPHVTTTNTTTTTDITPTVATAAIATPAVVPSNIRTSSLRHQHSNPVLGETKSVSTVTPPASTMVLATRKPSTSGFSSVRKSNRLSRVSIDGRRAQAAPLFGLFMKDLRNDNSNHSMDYLGGATSVGIAMSINLSTDKQPLRLVLSLERSMDEGAYVTPRLFIPKNMWHQPSIRLPHTEIKIGACESLMSDLAKLERWAKLDDLTGSLKALEALEDAVESLQTSLAKKLKRESMSAQSPTSVSSSASSSIHDGHSSHGSSAASVSSVSSMSSTKKSQSFMSWGTKLSKSVERMNAFSLTKAEDQYRNYVEVLQRLFIKAHILVNWWDHYVTMKKDVNRASPVCDVVLQRLTRICDTIDIVVGGFVVRDMAILLGKWLKRGGTWVNE